MEQRPSLSPETLAAQALGEVDPVAGGLAPAINLSTNYEQQPDGSYRQDRVYTRADNPTYEHAEGLLAALEGAGCACALFAWCSPGPWSSVPTWWSTRPPSTSTATATCWPVRC
jgi:cystathionine gamma-synthase